MRSWLRHLALVGCLLAHAARAEPAITTTTPQPLPELTFETMDGQPASLQAFKGKVVVLNLWATWCVPCREEMPSLDRLQARFADQPVAVVALSVDRAGPERVRKFLDEIGVTRLQVYRDPKAASTRSLRVPGLPATILRSAACWVSPPGMARRRSRPCSRCSTSPRASRRSVGVDARGLDDRTPFGDLGL